MTDSTDDEHGRTIDVGPVTVHGSMPIRPADDLAADMAADADTYDEPVAEPLPVDALLDPEGINREVEKRQRRYESEVVGPDGETRAQIRTRLLDRLDEMAANVDTAYAAGEIDREEATKLQLRIHREQAALLGLNVAQYSVPW